MVNKIKTNKDFIAKILSILAIALTAPEIINLLSQNFNNVVFNLILHGTLILSAIYILVLLFTKKELNIKTLLIPTLLIYGGVLANNIRGLIENNSWSYVYYIALYACIIIFYVLVMLNNNKTFKYILFMLFIIILAMNLLSVFTGSYIGLARLIIGLIIVFNLYLTIELKEEEKENEEN